ncbi:MAG: flagellar filament capping protein FliD [Candidatus Solibacter sp.]
MGTTSSTLFTGSSQFAADFQNSITRAVGMASLPITQMKRDVISLQGQSDALGTINTQFTALQTALAGITQAMSGASFQADVSDSSLVSATLGNGAMEGTYSVDVQKVGAYAMSMTAADWDGSALEPHTYQLWVGDRSNAANRVDITPADSSATSVAAAINAKAGSKVRATVVNVGSTSSPDYRISLQSAKLGDLPAELVDPARSLQTQQQPGDVATKAVSVSSNTWQERTNPAGAKHTYDLWIGDKGDPANRIGITPDDNSPAKVAEAINGNATAAAKIHATVVNLGTAEAPDNRLRLEALTEGELPLDLVDSSLQDQKTTGELAQYEINNSGKVVTSSSRQISISEGLTVNLLSASSGHPVNITVTRSTSALSSAISAFADAYNKVVDGLDAQHGATQGALGGAPIVSDLASALASLGTYNDSGTAASGLSAVGLDLGSDGHLTFNQFSLIAADFTNSSVVTNFFGSASGGGFLKVATDALDKVANSTSGMLATAKTSIQDQIDSTNESIAAKQEQVDALNERLLLQMSAADAAIAAMEQQYSFLSSMFAAMKSASDSYQ